MLSSLELWLEWLHDEISMAMDGLDREHVYELFERAVKDYICECPGPGVLFAPNLYCLMMHCELLPGSWTLFSLCCLSAE